MVGRESDLKINVLISKSHAHHMRHIGDGRRGYLVVNKDEFTFTLNNLAGHWSSSKTKPKLLKCKMLTKQPDKNVTIVCFSYKRNQPNSLKTLSDVNSVSLPSPKCMEVR